jgi:hypothetical protein
MGQKSYTKKHIIAIVSGLFIAVICLILSKTYRPYIYENNINDFHLADTFPNWLAVPAGTLFLWGLFKGKETFKKDILYGVISFILIEFLLSATIDYRDIVATLLSGGGFFSIYMIYKYLGKGKARV